MSSPENPTGEMFNLQYGRRYEEAGIVIAGVARNMTANELPKGHWGKLVNYSREDIVSGYICQFANNIIGAMIERSEGKVDPENLMFLGSERFVEVERIHFSKALRKHFFNFSTN